MKNGRRSEKELRKELGKKDRKYQAAISQAGKRLQETEERFNTKISAKERERRAVDLDKTKLEATVLQLKNEIQVISAELEATSKDAKLERNVLLSQIAAAKKDTAEITRCNQMAQEAWNAEKENLLSRLSELQTNLVLMASEKGSLSETNRELRTEAESLKAQLNYYIDILVRMEHEKQVLKTVSVSNAERLEALLQQNATMEKEIFILQQRVDENVKQHAYEIQQYKVAENCVKKQNEMLDREIEIRNKTIHERVVESVKQYTNEIQHCKVAENSVKEQNQMLDRKGEASSQQKD
jgi:chromosome segregation ATPase